MYGRDVHTALLFRQRDAGRVPAVGELPRRRVDRQAEIVAEVGARNALRKVFLVARPPGPREIGLRERRRAAHGHNSRLPPIRTDTLFMTPPLFRNTRERARAFHLAGFLRLSVGRIRFEPDGGGVSTSRNPDAGSHVRPARASVIRNVLPVPVVLSRLSSPPFTSTAHFAIARPSPDPPMPSDREFPPRS